MTDVTNTFESDEQLTNIEVAVSGAETATLTEADYTESGSGPYTYETTYTASATSGDLTFTLDIAEDSAGNDGASGESATVTLGETIVDDFEDTDFSAYGGTGSLSQNTSVTPVNGSGVAEATASGTDYVSLGSTTGLNAYPSQGDTFRCYFQTNELTTDLRFGWGAQSETEFPDCYELRMVQNDEVTLWEASSNTTLDSDTSMTFSTGTWYYAEVTWGTDDSMTVTIHQESDDTQIGTVSATDSTFTSGGISLTANATGNGTTTYYDYVHIL